MTGFSFKQLEVFVAVAELNSFTGAAAELYLTQPTVSAHINGLEQSLGTKLFARATRRQIHLTPEGQRIYPAAKKILSNCRDLQALVRDDAAVMPLPLGASTVPAQYLLPEILAGFLKKYPHSRYHMTRGDSAQIHELLKNGVIRLGFAATKLESENLDYYPLAEDKLVLVAENNEYYRALHNQGVYGRELLEEPTVVREEGSGTDCCVTAYLRQIGFPPEKLQIVARIDNPEMIKSMVMQGAGISIMSALAVRNEVADGRLLSFEMDENGLRRDIYMVCRRDIGYSHLERQLIEYIQKK